MPSIKLTDQLGLDVDAQPAPTSALLKYFQQIPSLRFDALNFEKLGGLTLDQPAVQSLNSGISFQNPVSLGDGAPTFSVGAGTHASIKFIRDADELPGRDETLDIPKNECYVAFGIEASVSADLSAAAGGLQFGATPSSKLEAVSYSRFLLDTGTPLVEAVRQTVAGFCIPLRSGDLADLPAGQIARVAVSGKLELSGSADLFATTNPLASAGLPAPLPTISVSAGGSATVGVSFEIEAEYEIVARKLDSGNVRLGWYRRQGTEVAVRAKVSEGLSAGFGTTDLFSQVVRAISGDAQADLAELASAGLPKQQAVAIQGAVKAATSRKLEIAVASEFSVSQSRGASFLFEIIPAALTEESRKAVDQALRGNLTGLHAPGLPGVSPVRSIWDNVRKRGVELDVNLLGILNYRSIATLTLEGEVLYEPATGSLVFSDRATAQRIRSTQVNFGADTQKLRHVLAESFLITAAYHGAKQLAGTPLLRCSHNFFELQVKTGRGDLARKLRAGVAVGLLSLEEAELPPGIASFGRTLFSVSTDYDETLVTGMFLDAGGAPLPRESYETCGRIGIQFLVQETDDDAVRREPAIDDDLWRRMKKAGQFNLAPLFPGVPAAFLSVIAADYTTIQWWADAMCDTAQKLASIRQWLDRHPSARMEDPEYSKLRQELAGYLRKVAANTREEFGQPWGLIAMNQLAGRGAGAKILISGPALVVNKSRALAAVTGP